MDRKTEVVKWAGGAPRIDVHVHLAGVGTQGSGCWISPEFRRRGIFVGLRMLLGITDRQMETTIDEDWAALVSGLVTSSDLDYAVVLGFDGVYDWRGEFDARKSQMIIPPSWVFDVCERYTNLLPAPSINPYRRDAMELLEGAIERGAVMIKWLPIVQGFDPSSRRSLPFVRRVAEVGIPLLVHAGSGEVTFRTVASRVGELERLVPALEMGARVICAHTAAPIHLPRQPNQLPLLRNFLARYPNFWVDNSGLTNPSRCRHLPRFAADPLIRDRTLHGSDFPVISTSLCYLSRLGMGEVANLESEANQLQREVRIKRALGLPEETFTRAGEVLANLDRWIPATASATSGGGSK
jgi:uncharacterized protein